MAKKNQPKASEKSGGGTPATDALSAAGVPFSTHSFTADPRSTAFGLAAAEALGVAPDRLFKTLLVDVSSGGRPELAVGVIPVDAHLDLKALASALGVKKAAMADPVIAERSTGYVRGGISPLGQRTPVPVVLDESMILHETVMVSGGRRGLDVELAPDDLLTALAHVGATYAPIARATRPHRHTTS